MTELLMVITLAILVEFIIERLKEVLPKNVGKFSLVPYYSLAVSIAVAFITQIDILASLGFITIVPIGYILTGIAISGGSKAVHELVAKLKDSRENEYETIIIDYATDIIVKTVAELKNTVVDDLKEYNVFSADKKLEIALTAFMKVSGLLTEDKYKALESITGDADRWLKTTIEYFVNEFKE